MRAFKRSYKVLAKRYKKHFWFNFSFSTNCFWSSGALRIKCFMSVFPLMGGLLKWSKICYIYPTMMSLGTAIPCLRGSKNIKNHVTVLNSAEIRIYSVELGNFCYIRKQRKIAFLLIIFTFIEFLKVAVINMTAILIMPAKFANPGILKTKGFFKIKVMTQFQSMTSPTKS